MTPTKTLRLASIISLKLHIYIFSTTAVPDSGANANNYLCYTYMRLNGASGGSNRRVSDNFGVAASFAFSDEFYLTAAHAKADVDLYYANIDSTRQRLGVRFDTALGNQSHGLYHHSSSHQSQTHVQPNAYRRQQ